MDQKLSVQKAMDQKPPAGIPPKPGFINRNLPYIVLIPAFILIHWGWAKLQDSPPARHGFTKEEVEDGKRQPIVKLYESLVHEAKSKLSQDSSKE